MCIPMIKNLNTVALKTGLSSPQVQKGSNVTG